MCWSLSCRIACSGVTTLTTETAGNSRLSIVQLLLRVLLPPHCQPRTDISKLINPLTTYYLPITIIFTFNDTRLAASKHFCFQIIKSYKHENLKLKTPASSSIASYNIYHYLLWPISRYDMILHWLIYFMKNLNCSILFLNYYFIIIT